MSEALKEQSLSNLHLDTLEKLLSDLKFGSVTIIIQDGKIVQIDKTEKHRF